MRPERLADGILVGGAAATAIASYRTGRLLVELWSHQAEFTVVRPVFVVSLLLATAVALLIASLRTRPALRANVALALASAAMTTYGLEIVLAFRPNPTHRRFEEQLRRLDELRGRGEDASLPIEPATFVRAQVASRSGALALEGSNVLPLGRVGNRLTVDCQEGDRAWMIYQTDAHGFHNPPGAWERVPLQIAAVGDSFTMGACVSSEDNMVAHLRRRFEATLNLGIAGSGPLIMLAVLREYLAPLRPQVVLWCNHDNDLLDLRREMGHPTLVRYLDAGFKQGLVAKQASLTTALADYVDRHVTPMLRERSHPRPTASDVLALKVLRGRLGLLLADPYGLATTKDEGRLFERILAEAKATVGAWGGRLVFVHLPQWREPPHQLGEGEHQRVQDGVIRDVLKAAGALDLQVVDVEEAFNRHSDQKELFACAGCHYAPEGYALAAQTVLAALEAAPNR